jgi:Rrf2 family transcriptional regulator, cysteine metabolism repressor
MLHISTRGEYGVRVMIDLARTHGQGPRSLNDISAKEGLPMPYLEQLIKRLRDARLVISERGAHGGYQLSRPPREIPMSDVLTALEGPLELYHCPSDKETHDLCEWGRAMSACSTRLLWNRLSDAVMQTLNGITLADLCAEDVPATYPTNASSHP